MSTDFEMLTRGKALENRLTRLFVYNTYKRICIVGAPCVGKTTLADVLHGFNVQDVDDILYATHGSKFTTPVIPELEKCCKQGQPLFSTHIVPCDELVLLYPTLAVIASNVASRLNERRLSGHTELVAKTVRRSAELLENFQKAACDKLLIMVVLDGNEQTRLINQLILFDNTTSNKVL